jgi:hypothetical protein
VVRGAVIPLVEVRQGNTEESDAPIALLVERLLELRGVARRILQRKDRQLTDDQGGENTKRSILSVVVCRLRREGVSRLSERRISFGLCDSRRSPPPGAMTHVIRSDVK